MPSQNQRKNLLLHSPLNFFSRGNQRLRLASLQLYLIKSQQSESTQSFRLGSVELLYEGTKKKTNYRNRHDMSNLRPLNAATGSHDQSEFKPLIVLARHAVNLGSKFVSKLDQPSKYRFQAL